MARMQRKFADRKKPKKKPPKTPKGAGGRRANLKKSAQRTAQAIQDRARSGKINGADIRKGGESTAKESAIAAANKYDRNKKEKGLQQSVGSLDRRINTALKEGNLDLAGDLRSRQNKFTKKLALERAHKAMVNAAPLAQRSKMWKRIKANPNMLNTRGKEIFDQTTQADFIDSTRRIQNVYPGAVSEMHPNPLIKIARGLGDAYEKFSPMANMFKQKVKGLPVIKEGLTLRKDLAKKAKGLPVIKEGAQLTRDVKNELLKNIKLPNIKLRKKDIPYHYPDMDNIFGEGAFPAQRYGLDRGFNAGEGEIKTPMNLADLSYTPEKDWGPDANYEDPDIIMAGQEPERKKPDYPSDDDLEAAIDRGIDPNFIFPVQDDPETDIIEQDMNTGSALQLAEAANVKGGLNEIIENVDPEWMRDKKKKQWFEGAPTNVFALPEPVKEELNKKAEENVKTYELETYGKEITSDDLAKANINEAWYNMNLDTPIAQQALLKAGIITKDMVDPAIAEITNVQEKDSVDIGTKESPDMKTLSNFYDNITWENAVKAGKNVGEKAASWSGADAISDALTWGTDKILNKATGWEPWSNYTGEEWTNKIAGDKELALQNINNSMELDDVQKSSLIDFVNQGGVDTNPVYMAGTDVQTNDPWNFQSDPVVFDDYVQQRLNKLR
jgi:hypothetical protein